MLKTKKLAIALGVGIFASAGLILSAFNNVSAGDKFPSKTIEVITHAGAGGGTDVNSRMMMLRGLLYSQNH